MTSPWIMLIATVISITVGVGALVLRDAGHLDLVPFLLGMFGTSFFIDVIEFVRGE